MSPISGISTGRQRQKLSPSVCFSAMVPLPGQMFIAAIVAVRWRANLPLSVTLIFVTNPLTMPVIYFAAYQLGATILDTPVNPIEFEMTWSWFGERLGAIWEPFLLGCLLMGIAAATLGYFAIDPLMALASG